MVPITLGREGILGEADRFAADAIVLGWGGDGPIRRFLLVTVSELLRAVSKQRAQLFVVGARSTSGVRRLLLGSVAEGALQRSPVLLWWHLAKRYER